MIENNKSAVSHDWIEMHSLCFACGLANIYATIWFTLFRSVWSGTYGHAKINSQR